MDSLPPRCKLILIKVFRIKRWTVRGVWSVVGCWHLLSTLRSWSTLGFWYMGRCIADLISETHNRWQSLEGLHVLCLGRSLTGGKMTCSKTLVWKILRIGLRSARNIIVPDVILVSDRKNYLSFSVIVAKLHSQLLFYLRLNFHTDCFSVSSSW